MQVTFDLPDDLAQRVNALENCLPQILELGLREFEAITHFGFSGIAEVLEFLATLPTPEEIIALRPSPALQTQIQTLLEKNRTVGLTPDEEKIWQSYEYLEHLVRMAKAKALLKLKDYSSTKTG
ncbi:hypothetical protein [Coleofasciculus sp. E1-EBD-02]|uniref:hypothetical protein n=1 Tax=Coleofasciculus sp. E1-EBD-02 TaxID=3068481 RepID=UPI0032FAC51C